MEFGVYASVDKISSESAWRDQFATAELLISYYYDNYYKRHFLGEASRKRYTKC